MLIANLYSAEAMRPEVEIALRDGLGELGEFCGGIVARNQVRRIQVTEGVATPIHFPYSVLDPYVDLHVFSAPLSERIELDGVIIPGGGLQDGGLAYMGSGVAWINSSSLANEQRNSAAHEVAHALGYVIPRAKHEDPEHPGHCLDSDCLMAPLSPDYNRMLTNGAELLLEDDEDKRQAILAKLRDDQDRHFCEDCTDEIVGTADDQIDILRGNRRRLGMDFFKYSYRSWPA